MKTILDKEFTREFMINNRGCYEPNQLMKCSFMSGPITLKSIIDSEIPIKDKYWFVCKKVLTKEQNQFISIGVAELVLEIYEKRYPENKAPRNAIQAAKDYLNGTIGIQELREKRAAAAAAAAYAAVDAADAAYAAAAAAAYAAVDAAYAAAAAYAADAAAADAAAAAYAAAADAADAADAAKKDFKDLLLIYLIDFLNKINQ